MNAESLRNLEVNEEDSIFNRLIANAGGSATKFDYNKPRTDLLDPDFILEVSNVLAFGASKYADNNWKKGLKILRLCGSTMRHLLALMGGETLDPESGLPHTSHIGCNAMFIGWMLKNKPEMDDRNVT